MHHQPQCGELMFCMLRDSFCWRQRTSGGARNTPDSCICLVRNRLQNGMWVQTALGRPLDLIMCGAWTAWQYASRSAPATWRSGTATCRQARASYPRAANSSAAPPTLAHVEEKSRRFIGGASFADEAWSGFRQSPNSPRRGPAGRPSGTTRFIARNLDPIAAAAAGEICRHTL